MSLTKHRKLRDLIKPVTTWNPQRSQDGRFDYIDLSAVDQDRKVITGARSTPTGEAPSRARQLVRAGDVLVSTVRPNLNGVAVVPQKLDGATASTGFCVLRPGAELNGRFLFHWVRSPNFVNDMVRKATGASYPAVSDRIIHDSSLPLPPIHEQRRIAEVLDRADELRAMRREAITRLDDLSQSIFLDMFGDPVGNPRGWAKSTLAALARENPSNGLFRKSAEYSTDDSGGLPVAWVENLFRGNVVDLSGARRIVPTGADVERYGLAQGDLLFCRSSLNFDGIAYPNVYAGPDNQALFECHIIRIRLDSDLSLPAYVNQALRIPAMRSIVKSKSKTSTMTTIDQKSLASTPIPVPPMELQRSFVDRLSVVDAVKAQQKAQIDDLAELFASLQHAAYRGEL
ncbi:restriction endonuclease subunit S [Micromonospora sp. NPDC048887]|uniref:restriction endonuclease subunit S n=1 Tax=unclassified Micromonospora TaxID=2617518 RepID=UPI00340F49CE